jgi:hypothetical protein
MRAEHHSNLPVKTKVLIAAVALGDLAGEVVTYLCGLANITGWDIVKFPCECAWVVLAFPLGWLGAIAGSLFANMAMQMRYVCLGVGVTMNAILWGWMVDWITRVVREPSDHKGFDGSTISLRLAAVRQSHVAAAHSRSKPPYARKGLVVAASRAIRRCKYFLESGPEGPEPCEHEEPKQ